jgi:hypothetical protein
MALMSIKEKIHEMEIHHKEQRHEEKKFEKKEDKLYK